MPNRLRILLIIPCYNEASRINLDEFLNFQNQLINSQSESALQISYLFANDGSRDNTSEKIQNFINSHSLASSWFLFNNPQNTGKANVISNAYSWFLNAPLLPDTQLSFDQSFAPHNYTWIGYWDADLATPLFEVINMITYRNIFYPKAEAVFASRVLKLGSQIVRKPLRHYLGRIFATVIYMALKVGSYDSQCGAKIFTQKIATKALAENFLSPWIFDVEIMLRLGEKNIVEYPLTQWRDIPGSKIKIFKECFRVLKDIRRIRIKYL